MTIAAGTLVLLGWRFGAFWHFSGPRGFRVMQPNTALAFILAGASLWSAGHGTRVSRSLARLLALALFAIALITLAETYFWPRAHFYRLLAPVLPADASISLMSEMSAFCFALLGIALLALGTSMTWRRLGHVCAMTAVLLASIVVVDYAYNLTLQFRLASQSVMALHAALAMLALGTGILAADPEIGLVRVLNGEGPGGSLARWLLPAIVLVPFVLGWLRLHAQRIGYLGTESGVAVSAASSALICAIVLLIYARRIDEIDDVRSAAEMRLRDSAQFHRQILDSAQEGIVVTDRESRFLLWNRAMEQLSGLSEAEVLGHRLRDMFPSFKDPRSFEAISRVLRGEIAARFDAQRPFAEAEHWFAVNHAALRSDTGEVTGVIVTYRNVTDRKNAENALRETSRFNQQIIDNLRDGVAVFDRELHVASFNPFLESMTGLEAEAAIGLQVIEVLPYADRQGLQEALRKALAGETVEMPDVRREVDGHESWSWIRLAPLRRADGQVSGVLAVISDISERKRNELALRLAQERTSLALASAKMADWEIDLETRRVTWSENLAALFGRPLETFDGAPGGALKFVHQEDAPRLRQAFEDAIVNRSGFASDFRVVLPDGQIRWLSSTGHVSETGEHGPRLLGITTDVTERRTLESHLRQAQKMDAVGQLAGGIAHDFNNLLTAILGYTQFLAEVVTDPRQAKDVNEILSAANRAAALTRQLLAFSRREPTEVVTLDVNGAIGGLTNMLQRLVGEHVELNTSLANDLHAVRADRSQLEQVLVNLVVNARDAMPRGGTIEIETSTFTCRGCDRTDAREAGSLCAVGGERHRRRDRRGDPAANLRAVLHDQGNRKGDGAGIGDRLRDRHAVRRLHLGLQRARSRNDVQGLFAGGTWHSRGRRSNRRGGTTGAVRDGNSPGRRGRGRCSFAGRDDPRAGGLQRVLGAKPTGSRGGVPGIRTRVRAPADRRHHAWRVGAGPAPPTVSEPLSSARALHVRLYRTRHARPSTARNRGAVPAEALRCGRAPARGKTGDERITYLASSFRPASRLSWFRIAFNTRK